MHTVARYKFGAFELDPGRFELRRDGVRVDVQPKVLRLLCHLVTHRERAVDNAELLRTVWPDTKVSHGSVKRAVLGARQALGERAASQATIRTVRGVGYQFVREVTQLESPAATAVVATPSPPQPPDKQAAVDVFLEREGVVSWLEQSLQQALSGTVRCVLLMGGPGTGKTRTASELYRRAREQGAQTWLARCADLEGAPAFWPFIQILRGALRDRGAAEVQRLMGAEGADIAAAMPELRGLTQAAPQPEPSSSQAARFRLYDSVSCFLRRAAEAQPVLLGFDDLHQADAATLQLLLFVTRQLTDAPLLVVGTLRQERTEPTPPTPPMQAAEATGQLEVPRLLTRLSRHEAVRSIELRGFSAFELARYLERAAELAPSEHVIAKLHEQTAGNPLFVRQLLDSWRALRGQGQAVSLEALTAAQPSPGLRGAITHHLEVVTPGCRRLLRLSAVLGRDFSAAQLSQLADQPAPQVCEALESALTTGLVQPIPGELGTYRFTHALIRDALYAELSATERARLHGLAGLALDSQGHRAPSYVRLSEVARHFVLAAPAFDGGRALPACLRAAESALDRLAHEEAAQHLEHALQLSAYAAPDPSAQLSLLLRKGDALTRTSEPEAGRSVLFEAFELARHQNDPEGLFAAANLIAGRPEPGEVDERQLALLEEALSALPAHDGRRVLLLAMQAKSLAYSSARGERARRAQLALSQARLLAEPRLRADALRWCFDALVGPDHLEQRCQLADELVSHAQSAADTPGLLRAWTARVETCAERGDMQSVDAAITQVEALAARVRDPLYRWQALAVRSMQAFVQGRLELAEQRARAAWQLGASIHEELARHVFGAQTFGLFVLTGRFHEAQQQAEMMAAAYPGIAGWVAARGIGCALLGQPDQARRCLAQIMDRGVTWITSEAYMLSGLSAVAELCQIVGDPEAATALYAVTLPYAEHHGITHLAANHYGPMTRMLAGLAACAGQHASAAAHYRQALRSADALPSPTYSCMINVSHATLMLETGEVGLRAEARASLVRAHDQAARLGMSTVASGAAWVAQRHGLELSAPNVYPLQRSQRGSRS